MENQNSDQLNDAYAKFHKPSEHSGMVKLLCSSKKRVIFKQYIPKKHRCFGIKFTNSIT